MGLGVGITDNASVNIVPFGTGTALALTEAKPGAYLVDTGNLQTIGRVTYTDGIPGSLTSAHCSVMEDLAARSQCTVACATGERDM